MSSLTLGKLSKIFVLLFLSVFAGQGLSAAASRTIVLLQPDATEARVAGTAGRESGKAYIARSGQVVFAARELFLGRGSSGGRDARTSESFAGAEFVLSFFPGQNIRINVDSESESKTGSLSIGGRQQTGDFSTFSMTITDESYLITFQDLQSSMTYKVVGDMATGIGRVTEFDLDKLPPVYDSAPVIPPVE
jgi:hypothetical protein